MKLIQLLLCEGITANVFADSSRAFRGRGVEKHGLSHDSSGIKLGRKTASPKL